MVVQPSGRVEVLENAEGRGLMNSDQRRRVYLDERVSYHADRTRDYEPSTQN